MNMELTVDFLEALDDIKVIEKATELTNFQYNDNAAAEASLLYYTLFPDLCSLKISEVSPLITMKTFLDDSDGNWPHRFKQHLMRQSYVKKIRFIMKKNPEAGIKKINLDLYKLRYLFGALDMAGQHLNHEEINALLDVWTEYYPPIKSFIGSRLKEDEILHTV